MAWKNESSLDFGGASRRQRRDQPDVGVGDEELRVGALEDDDADCGVGLELAADAVHARG